MLPLSSAHALSAIRYLVSFLQTLQIKCPSPPSSVTEHSITVDQTLFTHLPKGFVVLHAVIHRFQNVIEGKLQQSSHHFSLPFPGKAGGALVWGVGSSDFKCWGWSKDFGGTKNSIPGLLGEGKFWRYSFGWLHLTRDFLGIQNNLKIPGSALVSSPGSSANKVQLTFFSAVKIFKARKIGRGIV